MPFSFVSIRLWRASKESTVANGTSFFGKPLLLSVKKFEICLKFEKIPERLFDFF